MSSLIAFVLAAGMGTRMKSAVPKVLHRCAGRALVEHSVHAALDAGATSIVVVVSPATRAPIAALLGARFGERVRFATQEVARGTGDAARVAFTALSEDERASATLLVLCGDTPLVDATVLAPLLAARDSAPLNFLSAVVEEPHGYGRVLRDAAGAVVELREQRDLRSDAERAVREVNAGVYVGEAALLASLVAELAPNNAQGELYLTDVVAGARGRGLPVNAVVGDRSALVGVNDRAQLAAAEELLFARQRRRLGEAGVTVRGDARVDVTVTVAPDVELHAGVALRGRTSIGAGTIVDVGCVVVDSSIGARALLRPYTIVMESEVRDGAQLGPFAHLRPASVIGEDAHIGNFVETKATNVGPGAKANHLAYLGDGDIGARANIGAGTIFCNYDGFLKHRAVVGEDAFIGSDSQLIAPVTIGARAYVGSGSSITEDVPADALAIARARQVNKPDRGRQLRERLARLKAEKAAKK